MDDRHHIEFLRCQAHESRIRALMMEHPEAGRWLDLAREYDRQTEMLARLYRARDRSRPAWAGTKRNSRRRQIAGAEGSGRKYSPTLTATARL